MDKICADISEILQKLNILFTIQTLNTNNINEVLIVSITYSRNPQNIPRQTYMSCLNNEFEQPLNQTFPEYIHTDISTILAETKSTVKKSEESIDCQTINNLSIQICAEIALTKLTESDKQCVSETVCTVIEVMTFYKAMSYMYPDWLNCSENRQTTFIDSAHHQIFKEIGYFMMTHIISERYIEIPHYRKSINNPFHRGMWHMSSVLDFDKLSVCFASEEPLCTRLFKFFDVFCLLSRQKTRKEFESYYKTIYRCITSETDNNKIIIPFWIYDQYASKRPTDLFTDIERKTNISSLYMKNIEPDAVFFLISNSLMTNPIQIGSMIQADTSSKIISRETMGRRVTGIPYKEEIFDSKSHRRKTIIQNNTLNPSPALDNSHKYLKNERTVHKQQFDRMISKYPYNQKRATGADINRNWRTGNQRTEI